MRAAALTLSVLALLLAGCKSSTPDIAYTPDASAAMNVDLIPSGFRVLYQDPVTHQSDDFIARASWCQLNKAGTEATIWVYNLADVTCDGADKPQALKADEWKGLKLALKSDTPLAAGTQHVDGVWLLLKGKIDPHYTATFLGADAKVDMERFDTRDGGFVSGELDVAGPTPVTCGALVAKVCQP